MNVHEAFALFKKGWTTQRMAHACVIAGPPRGRGGELAERVLALLFCETPGASCGQCAGCRGAREHTHPDLAWLEPEMKSRILSVESMRGLRQKMFRTSFCGGWKAGVVVGADRLSDAAANAFLKLLEEPPPRTLFLLLTDSPQFLLPTIVSRCQRMTLSGETDDLLPEWKERMAATLMQAGSAGPVTAMALAERFNHLLTDMKTHATETMKKEAAGAPSEEEAKVVDARIQARYKELRQQTFIQILRWYRDILLAAAGLGDETFHHQGHAVAIRKKAAGLTLAQAQANIGMVEDAYRMLERNIPDGMALNLVFGRLR